MIDITNDLVIYLKVFQKQFGDIVSLRELPQSITTEELIEAIKLSIEKKVKIFFLKNLVTIK